jgi:hypothetical protein
MGERTTNYLQEWAAVLQVYIRKYTTYCTETNLCAIELNLAFAVSIILLFATVLAARATSTTLTATQLSF